MQKGSIIKFVKIGIYYNEKQVTDETVSKLLELLSEAGETPAVFRNTEEFITARIDRLIVLGGDGTVLRAVRSAPEIPIVGVNFGTLGFLTEFERDEFRSAVGLVLDANSAILRRSMLEVEFEGRKSFCLNELSLFHRANEQDRGIARIKVNIDGNPAWEYFADGLIVSTPTGSTAYSLSAGGCIMTPDANTFLITPVCAFSLRSRPVVCSENSVITLALPDAAMSVLVDGTHIGQAQKGDVITVRKAERAACFLTRDRNGFFRKLANKIN